MIGKPLGFVNKILRDSIVRDSPLLSNAYIFELYHNYIKIIIIKIILFEFLP